MDKIKIGIFSGKKEGIKENDKSIIYRTYYDYDSICTNDKRGEHECSIIKDNEILDKFPFISRYYFKKCDYEYLYYYEYEKETAFKYDIVILIPDEIDLSWEGIQPKLLITTLNYCLEYEELLKDISWITYKYLHKETNDDKFNKLDHITCKHIFVFDGKNIRHITRLRIDYREEYMPIANLVHDGINHNIDNFIAENFKTKLSMIA